MKTARTIILLIAACLALLPGSLVSAQNKKLDVQGTVTDAKGDALVGAMVYVKGSSTGTMTDAAGKFKLVGVASNASLVASLIGYEDQTVAVDGRSIIDFILKDDSLVLDEAVAIGYGNQRKLTLTGSVTTTTGDELVKNSAVNMSQGLAGRLSGVIVNNRSGEPGRDDAVMFIRGRSTLGTNSPLIIIDGVPGRNEEFGRLTGEEIESITVLKDASAAIYGARSANGVILVTTKRGKYNEAPDITFTYDLGLQQPTRLVQMADAVLYTTAYNAELAITGGARMYNDTQLEHYRTGDDPILYPNTNWLSEIIKPLSPQHKYGVTINGGSERVAYFVQLNGQYQDGIYVKSATNYNQINFRSNIDIKVTKSLTLGFDIQARQQHKNYSAFASDETGIFYNAVRMKPTGATYYPNGLLRGGLNPAVLVQDITGYNRSIINSVNTTISANWDLGSVLPGLSVNGKVAYDLRSNFRKQWHQQWKYYRFNEITEIYEENLNDYWTTPTLNEYQNHYTTTTLNANINYDHTFGGAHHVTALAGFEQSAYRRDYFTAGRNKFNSDILDELFAGDADKTYFSASGQAWETARRSFFGRAGYDYKSKYMIQAIFRYDGSENFPADRRWGFFPGVSVGWRLSEESFMKDNLPWLTNLKLRASYGEQGNDQIDSFQFLTTYGYTSGSAYKLMLDGKEVSMIIPGTIPNPLVTWEVARTWNVGIDGSVKNGLLTWELEWFRTRRSNILTSRNASIPYYTGMTSKLPDENLGIVRNSGIELQLGHENKVGDLRYRINGNFLYARNVIEYMDEAPWPEGHDYMKLEGLPMGSGLYYHVLGVFKTQEQLDSYPHKTGATLGDLIYEDMDGDNEITTLDRKRSPFSSIPQIVYGVTFDARWKNFDFTMLLQGQGRVRFYYAPLMDPVSYNVEKEAAEKAWTLDNPDSDWPRLGSTVSLGSVNRSDFYIKNAAFLRLKNLELGYTIPRKVFGPRAGIRSIRFYIGGYNLLTFSQLKSVDPENNDEGYQTYPQMKIYNTGVKVMF
ncbi:MAG: TonB-dependent receptor [Bacteroidales bacterium]|nr:TonB-dependent receptor [Bacteroidales bacterium]